MVEEDIEFETFDGDVVSKSEYRDEIINKYIEANIDGLSKITNFEIGSEAYHLADVMATFILEHREMIDGNYRMSMIHTAEGEFLDNYGDMVGVHRIGSSPSIGNVVFTRLKEDVSYPIKISDGTQIATDDAISFIVDNEGNDLTIDVGSMSISANVICEQDGSYTNILPNTLTLVMGDLGNEVSVINPTAFTGGEDVELDDDYRNRILQSPFQNPVGSLAWYESVSNEIESVHDTLVEKGEDNIEGDVIITFNPVNREDVVVCEELNEFNEDNDVESTSENIMTVARKEIIEKFTMKEYDMVGITRSYHLVSKQPILVSTENNTYYFALLLKEGYNLENMKQNIINKIINFNKDGMIGIECNLQTLCIIIENEIEGVDNCRIVMKDDNDNYYEVVEPIEIDERSVYEIDMTNIENRIREMRFNIDIVIEE